MLDLIFQTKELANIGQNKKNVYLPIDTHQASK
jgi:hypothetical protein